MKLISKHSGKAKKSAKKSTATSKYPKAICEGPLRIGDREILCAVLENGERVLSQRETLETLGRSRFSGGGRPETAELPTILRAINLQEFIPAELKDPNKSRVVYQPKAGGRTAYGIRAEILPIICEVYLTAEAAGALHPVQNAIADTCRTLQNGFARVGIAALIDEATGYQNIRAKNALAEILERYLTDKAQEWTKTFPLDFYRQIYRLRNWPWEELERGTKPPTPMIVGRFTDNLVYKRIAPGILDELRERNPIRAVRHHQWFEPQYGHPELRLHIERVITVMKLSDNWDDCLKKMNNLFPIHWQKGDLFYVPPK